LQHSGPSAAGMCVVQPQDVQEKRLEVVPGIND